MAHVSPPAGNGAQERGSAPPIPSEIQTTGDPVKEVTSRIQIQEHQSTIMNADTASNDTNYEDKSEESSDSSSSHKVTEESQGNTSSADEKSSVPEFKAPTIGGEGQKKETGPRRAEIKSGKSPAELAKDSAVPLPYKEPGWGKIPQIAYGFDTLKGGIAMDPIRLDRGKEFLTVGRLAQCDIFLEHPSISRFHCILQYGPTPERREGAGGPEMGWHLYDLGSTHGTWLNKQQAPAHKYIRLHVGHVLKFGWSTRFFILTGPDEDSEEESAKTVTQIVQERKTKEEEKEKPPETKGKSDKSSSGISWGMEQEVADQEEKDDSEGEDIDFDNLHAGEDYYREDPMKALRHFFDRTGNEMEFEYVEKKTGKQRQWVCRIELPVDNKKGEALSAEVNTTGSKKEAQTQCAMEACKILDRQGVLRSGKGVESFKEKEKERMMENDFYESDEDIFLDRTGELERKRALRKKRMLDSAHESGRAKSYEELRDELDEIEREIASLGEEVKKLEVKKKPGEGSNESEDYSEQSVGELHDAKVKKSKLRLRIAELKITASKLDKMCRVAKPTPLPALRPGEMKKPDAAKKAVWIGSMKGHRLRKAAAPAAPVLLQQTEQVGCNDAEVEEEEEEDDTAPSTAKTVEAAEKNTEDPIEETETSSTASTTCSSPQKSSDISSKPITVEETKSPETQKSAQKRTITEEPSSSGREQPKVKKLEESLKTDRTEVIPNESRPRDSSTTKAKKSRKGVVAEPNPYDPDYATWLPPTNQAGDGKTSLNAKYGY